MLIRNSDTGQMMELDLATGDMKPLSDGPPQTPTADAGSPGKAPDSPDDFVDSSPEKGGRKRPSFSESVSKMRFSRRAAEVAGVSRATKDVAFEASKVQLDVTLEKIKFLKAALKEQERAARAYYAAQAEVCARVKDLAAGTRAGKESEIPNFKGSYLGRFPLVSADFWTSDHLSERSRRVDAFSGTRARGTLMLKRT